MQQAIALFRGSLITVTTFALAMSHAYASLIIDITGQVGSNETTWIFSGSTTAPGEGFIDFSTFGSEWINIGDYVAPGGPNSASFSALESTAVITNGQISSKIVSVGVDDDGAGDGASVSDDIGIALDGFFIFAADDVISWSGVATAGFDISVLNIGSYGPALLGPGTFFGLNDITVTVSRVSGTVPAPAPATLALFGFGLIRLIFRKRALASMH